MRKMKILYILLKINIHIMAKKLIIIYILLWIIILKIIFQIIILHNILHLSRSSIKFFKNNFNNINIYLCYYHFRTRIRLHLPQLRAKKLKIKNTAELILINIKLLCFINKNDIDNLYNKIQKNYNNKHFVKFFNYFNDTYINDISR